MNTNSKIAKNLLENFCYWPSREQMKLTKILVAQNVLMEKVGKNNKRRRHWAHPSKTKTKRTSQHNQVVKTFLFSCIRVVSVSMFIFFFCHPSLLYSFTKYKQTIVWKQ